jgi:hypothetical protein
MCHFYSSNRWVRRSLAFENLELLSRIIHMVRTVLSRYKVLAGNTSVSTRTMPHRVRIHWNYAVIAIKTVGIDDSQCRQPLIQSTVRTLGWRQR